MLVRTWHVWRAYRTIVQNPRFAPIWASQLISNLGDTFNYIALVVVVFRITQSGTALALVTICQIVPTIVLALFAGVVVDRVPRKLVLVGSEVVRGGLVGLLILADQTQQVGLVYLAAAGLAAAGSFFRPALQAVIPTLLTEDALLAANSVTWSTEQLVQILASAAAGGLILWAGPSSAFAFNAVSFWVSAALLARLPLPRRASPPVDAPAGVGAAWRADLRGGLAYARHTPWIARLLGIQALASLAVGGTGALLVVLAERHLRLPPAGFPLLLAAIGLGALLGPVLLTGARWDIRDPRLVFLPYLIRGAGDILLAWVTPVPLALGLLVLYGVGTSTGMVTYNALLQAAVPDRLRGRVYALFDLVWSTLEITSLGLAGWLSDRLGIQAVYYLGGGLLALAGILGLGLLPRRLLPDATAAPVPGPA